ncbi:ATP-dependent DNA helicase RecG [Ichthyobacterium seriolicida]|nr:ATP-dependent DNA helicase RecG [Ichthyobacterium seriolicida]
MEKSLNTPIEYLKGIGPHRAKFFKKELNVSTYGDLIEFFPYKYIDKSQFYTISEINATQKIEVQLIGRITSLKNIGEGKKSRLCATFKDDTGTLELVWFKGISWIKNNIKIDERYVIFGVPNIFNGKYSIAHPEMSTLSEYKKSRIPIQAVYPSTEALVKVKISRRSMQNAMKNLFVELKGEIEETLTSEIIDSLNIMSKKAALINVHFPKTLELLARAQYRLKFEELFFIQLGLIDQKISDKKKYKGYSFNKIGIKFNAFYNDILPFSLTRAQKRVIKEIRRDLNTGAQMNRLLQGDVGSGKTIIAVLSMLIAIDNGFQACIIAPTEILAIQHYTSIQESVEQLGIKTELLTGSTSTKNRRNIHENLLLGTLDILVGTHALFEDAVEFKNLGIAIIDEQHKFGVAQRARMWKKNKLPPHVLIMTATPIPRTLAMSLYGNLDLSTIDELPPNRKPIKTVHKYDSNRLAVWGFIKDEIKKGRQVYVIYPLIEESEKMDYKDLMDGYESMSRYFPMPEYQISIVHGKMSSADKEFEMNRFSKGETQIIVATTVIEVGINVPNASVMVIESAERFGLSQLHQLRGRIGRGSQQSFCVLMSSFKLSDEAKIRLDTMVRTNDGFEIANVDLKLRGPGNLKGLQQSGVLKLKIADITKDGDILTTARSKAMEILKDDPQLEKDKNKSIKKQYSIIKQTTNVWRNIS